MKDFYQVKHNFIKITLFTKSNQKIQDREKKYFKYSFMPLVNKKKFVIVCKFRIWLFWELQERTIDTVTQNYFKSFYPSKKKVMVEGSRKNISLKMNQL